MAQSIVFDNMDVKNDTHPGMQLERTLKILRTIKSELKLKRLNIEISCLQ